MLNIIVFFSVFCLQTADWNTTKKGVAIAGYDPVSYFENNPKEGDSGLSFQYSGAIFYFADEQNLKTFKTDPEKYLPQYGGYCAYAMGATGEKVDINPKTYKITKGRLYLFYNARGTNTLEPWNENETALKEQADRNWMKISTKNK